MPISIKTLFLITAAMLATNSPADDAVQRASAAAPPPGDRIGSAWDQRANAPGDCPAQASYTIALSSASSPIVVAVGDVVRLQPVRSGTVFAYESCGTGSVRPVAATQGVPFVIPTGAPGQFRYQLQDTSGRTIAAVAITVVRTDLSGLTVADQYGYTRDLVVTVEPPGAPVSFSSSTSADLQVSVKSVSGSQVKLAVTALASGTAHILASIISPSGAAIIGRTKVYGFTLETDAQNYILITEIFPDQTAKAQGTLTMQPLIPGLPITMTTFVSGVTFDDSTTIKHITSDDFTRAPGGGTYIYYLLQTLMGHSRLCHTFTAYEDGFQISRGW